MSQLVLPELGEGIEKAVIAAWHVKLGDSVKQGDDLLEVVTDKATFNVSAEHSGVLKKILVDEGREAAIGQALAVIE